MRFTFQADSDRPFARFNAAAQSHRLHASFGAVTDDGGVFADFTVAANDNAVCIVSMGVTANGNDIGTRAIFLANSDGNTGTDRDVMLSLDLRFITDSDRVIARPAAGVARFRFITDSDSVGVPSLALGTDGNAVFFQSGGFRTDSNLIGVRQFFRGARIRFPTDSNVTLCPCPSICPQSRRVLFHRHRFSADSNNSIDRLSYCIPYSGPCFRTYENRIITGIFKRLVVIFRIDFRFLFFLPHNMTILIHVFPYFYFIIFINADRNIMDLPVIRRIRRGNHIGRQKSAPQKRRHDKNGKQAVFSAGFIFPVSFRQFRSNHPGVPYLAPNQFVNLVHCNLPKRGEGIFSTPPKKT